MKSIIIIVLSLSSIATFSQNDLKFNKKFIDCEDRWVVFNANKSESFPFGFIYIDPEAGLTLHYEGAFTISKKEEYIPSKIDTASIKYRLTPSNQLVSILPKERFKELNISEIPNWLKYYKKDNNSTASLYKWGYVYNAWNKCKKALIYLEDAYKKESNYDGLATELAFSYNCLEEYEKAIVKSF